MPTGCSPCRAAAFFALAALGCLVLAACSPGADYPSLFPSVHDIPPARAETPLDSNQVQQATEDLISARDRLTAEAGAQGKSTANSKAAAKPLAKSSANSAGKSSGNGATAAAAVTSEPGRQAGGRATLGTDAEPVAGTETK
jgi:hypothetical protein